MEKRINLKRCSMVSHNETVPDVYNLLCFKFLKLAYLKFQVKMINIKTVYVSFDSSGRLMCLNKSDLHRHSTHG